MNNKLKILLLIVCILSLAAFVIYWYVQNYTPKYRWNENFVYNDNQPYGLKLFYDLLSATHPKEKLVFIDNSLKDFLEKEDSSALLIFVGASFTADTIDSKAILDFVKRGNNAIIASFES